MFEEEEDEANNRMDDAIVVNLNEDQFTSEKGKSKKGK